MKKILIITNTVHPSDSNSYYSDEDIFDMNEPWLQNALRPFLKSKDYSIEMNHNFDWSFFWKGMQEACENWTGNWEDWWPVRAKTGAGLLNKLFSSYDGVLCIRNKDYSSFEYWENWGHEVGAVLDYKSGKLPNERDPRFKHDKDKYDKEVRKQIQHV